MAKVRLGISLPVRGEIGIAASVKAPEGVEVSTRVKDGKSFTFLLNHNADSVTLQLSPEPQRDLLTGETTAGPVQLAGHGVMILEQI
jgi:beta-galactosidase